MINQGSSSDEHNLADPEPQAFPEIVVGLVAPVGVDFEAFHGLVNSAFAGVDYETCSIRLTSLLEAIETQFPDVGLGMPTGSEHLDEKIDLLMDAGNRLREVTQDNAAFARLAAHAIRHSRTYPGKPKTKTAYIIRQLKRPEEVKLLRDIYGGNFILVSAYARREERVGRLAAEIASSSAGEYTDDQCRQYAEQLITKDEDEVEEKHGQRLRKVFPLGDVIIDLSGPNKNDKTFDRFVRAFFGDNSVTPNRAEYGMNAARSASLRSSDLSRQVGAAISRPTGEMIATGCNEVPSPAGGTYWEGDSGDFRDFKVGVDANVEMKMRIASDLLRRLSKSGWLKDDGTNPDLAQLINRAFSKEDDGPLHDSMLMDLIEFGRIIHAEMSALMDAARLGRQVDGAILYSTTFPCHMCARHIVASGIRKVIFIEPYPKSLAGKLYKDSIALEASSGGEDPRVIFESFVGIAPNRYAEVFARGKRKHENGTFQKWMYGEPKPLISGDRPTYLWNEPVEIEKLWVAIESWVNTVNMGKSPDSPNAGRANEHSNTSEDR